MRPPFTGLRSGNRNPVVLGRKFCSRCGRWRPAHDFSMKPNGRLQTWCITCQRVSNRGSRARLSAQQLERRREYERIWHERRRRAAGISELPRPPLPAERVFLSPAPLLVAMADFVNGHEHGWQELSRRAKIDGITIRRLRHGESRRVRVDVADKLAVAMGMTLSLLYPRE